MNCKDNRILKTYYCINPNCNNKIHYKTYLYGTGLCKSCSTSIARKGTKLSKNTKIKISESHKHYHINNPNIFAKENHPNWKIERHKKHYCIICNKNEISYSNWKNKKAMCISCLSKNRYNTPEKALNYKDGRTLKIYYCKCGEEITYQSALYGNGECYSCAKKGQLTHGKGNYYREIYMRSSYEIKFAYFLDCSGHRWLYESRTFDLGNTTYTPDFYLVDSDCYIEIKGYWRKDAKEKFKLFKKYCPRINIKVLNQEKLIELGVL